MFLSHIDVLVLSLPLSLGVKSRNISSGEDLKKKKKTWIEVTTNEIEAIIKKTQQTKVLDQMASQANFTKHSKKNQHLSSSNYSKKFKRKEDSQAHFMRPVLS